jgi:hypothetical protein
MPRSKHYKGHGDEVYSAMKRTYGDTDTAKRVFYATENKQKNKGKRGRKRGGK